MCFDRIRLQPALATAASANISGFYFLQKWNDRVELNSYVPINYLACKSDKKKLFPGILLGLHRDKKNTWAVFTSTAGFPSYGIFIFHKEQFFHRKYDIQIFFSLILVQFYVLISFNVNGDSKVYWKFPDPNFFIPSSEASTFNMPKYFSFDQRCATPTLTLNLTIEHRQTYFFLLKRRYFFGSYNSSYFNSIIIILNASTRFSSYFKYRKDIPKCILFCMLISFQLSLSRFLWGNKNWREVLLIPYSTLKLCCTFNRISLFRNKSIHS